MNILIIGYNRPNQVRSLIKTLLSINETYNNIYISVDFNNKKIRTWQSLKNEFNEINWQLNDINLGLEKHIIQACDSMSNKGDFIFLEEDISISIKAIKFINEINNNLSKNSEIRQVSLSSLEWNELNKEPFYPITEGLPFFLTKVSSSWGVFYRSEWWNEFSEFYKVSKVENEFPHKSLYKWKKSWKKHHIKFINSKNYFVLYPSDHLAIHEGQNGTNLGKHIHNFSKEISESFNLSNIKEYIQNINYKNYYDINLKHSKAKSNINIQEYFLRSFPLLVIIKHLKNRYL